MAYRKLLLLFLLTIMARAAETPYKVPEFEQAGHRKNGKEYIRSERFGIPDTAVDVNVIVDPKGNVESVHLLSGPSEPTRQVEALEKQNKYEPFVLNGKPVRAVVHEIISVVPPERWKSPRHPFPDIRDWTSLRAKLVRRYCQSCPYYSVEVRGNGQVLFEGSPLS